MSKNSLFIILGAMTAFATTPANATDWNVQMDLCAAALKAESLAAVDNHRLTLIRARSGAAKRVTIKIVPNDGGDAVVAECTIRKGAVTKAEIKKT
ncbi:MAG: hypothetical protein AAGC77_06425 [Pseudomonadota bacterium]